MASGKSRPRPRKDRHPGLEILFEDRDLIVVNKAAGLLTISAGREDEPTAYATLTDYVRKGNPKSRNRVFIVHRLDRDTSGALVFARSEPVKRALQDNWEAVEKIYLALVEGHPEPPEGTITSYLVESAAMKVHSTRDATRGKLSHTRYRTIKRVGARALLAVELLTGRKNQIRAHLSERGWPIVGDKKYGDPKQRGGRMALHAFRLSFDHPVTRARMTFDAPPPSWFRGLAGIEDVGALLPRELSPRMDSDRENPPPPNA